MFRKILKYFNYFSNCCAINQHLDIQCKENKNILRNKNKLSFAVLEDNKLLK